ncbi:hypothetical protein L7F22_006840 [Adiantum nelumboides]|nr:hypothetical protein [Adiantum nelumboides]
MRSFSPVFLLLLALFSESKTSHATHAATSTHVLPSTGGHGILHARRILQLIPAAAAAAAAGPWEWKDAMIKALRDNNRLGNIMINRVGQVWWDRKVPDGLNAKEYDILINGVPFHVCTFKGSAFFQTMGWYGWENWAFQGQYKRVDKFTVIFN